MASQDHTVPPCPNHNTHSYHFHELKQVKDGAGSNQQEYFRAQIFFRKKPELTDDFFHEHWKSVHADLTMQVADASSLLLRYEQYHQEPRHKTEIQDLLVMSGGTMNHVPYDGCAEFHTRTKEDFVAFMGNVYGSKKLLGCGTRFVDTIAGYDLMTGYVNLILGPAIPGAGGDGIQVGDSRLINKGSPEADKGHTCCPVSGDAPSTADQA